MSSPYRVERDFLGEKQIPAQAYWGVHTARAIENFPISGTPVSAMPDLIRAFGHVKKAAARANLQLGALDDKRARAIMFACERLVAGEYHDQFVVDVIQGGAGTSTNMNANEVIANLALEKLGFEKGRYDVLHPNDHVNASQSTNDVYPTAVRLSLWTGIDRLLASMARLRAGFEAKAEEFKGVLKIGRTQLQDAVPMTLGQEFSTYAVMLEEDEARLREARALIQEINLGATAIGTGINAPAGYADLACQELAGISGIPVVKSKNLVEATQDTGAFVQLSGVLKRVATKLSKTCNDLRLLSSGPQAGFGDIKLPARQAGSSIMPGKVNPVIPEVMNQVAFEVIGNDVTVTLASEAGQLQLNAFEPIMGWSLFKSIKHLSNACLTLHDHCVTGIEANHDLLARRVRESVTLVTALNPIIGYEKAAMIAKTAIATGAPIDEVAQALGILTREQMEALLVPEKLTEPLRLAN
ncbi:aspartate ammonia-lyase [Ramlibacter tataouinensis]|uniref:Candidate Aspartate ammonia-lyase n=1 Tax=Ramlibacter tataouinensis (strain ATCC BAA-407 / DSM 14655 / LMG 21543 / TTB310) TaxID=365046 RepID=F5XZJ2_RAMTT|nr:aspartate ammonia-lyase [Ramlibacter tataouinensis]AEG92021.1 Candidate Aspartate ammonia-lyase [Ramlibacter tataouinensis TTB310]